jgi:hypothetical protein
VLSYWSVCHDRKTLNFAVNANPIILAKFSSHQCVCFQSMLMFQRFSTSKIRTTTPSSRRIAAKFKQISTVLEAHKYLKSCGKFKCLCRKWTRSPRLCVRLLVRLRRNAITVTFRPSSVIRHLGSVPWPGPAGSSASVSTTPPSIFTCSGGPLLSLHVPAKTSSTPPNPPPGAERSTPSTQIPCKGTYLYN